MNQEYSNQREEEYWSESKKNDYIILAQLNFCRYLYRVSALMDKHRFVQTPYLREKLMFLVNKNIMIKLNCLNEVM